MILRRSLVLGLAFLLVAGCGWRLRGSMTLPADIDAIYLQGSGALILEEMAELLKSSQITVVDRPSQAQLIINVQRYDEERRIVAVGANTRVSEYELTVAATFSISNAQGHELLPTNEVSLIRSYDYDQNNILAMEAEERLIRQEMRRELARQIIGRLHFIDLTPPTETEANGQSIP